MSAIDRFAERARSVARTIVLPEGQDPRVIIAANKAVDEKVVAKIIVLGTEAEISAACFKRRSFELTLKFYRILGGDRHRNGSV